DRARAGAPLATDERPEGDVGSHGLPREQRILLEHHATIGPRACDLCPVNPHPTGGGPDIAGDGVEQRRLAATGGAKQADEGARLDTHARVLERVGGPAVAPEGYRNVPDLDAARLFGSSVWNGAHGIAPRGLLDGHAHEATRTRRAGGATRSVVAGGTQRCSDRIAASPIAGRASAARP